MIFFNIYFLSFPPAEKKQNAAAAPDAIKVTAKARLIHTAPAEAEKRLWRYSAEAKHIGDSIC